MGRMPFKDLMPDHISERLGLPLKRLFKMCRNIEAYYHATRIVETAPGKVRPIDEPKPWLKAKLRALHRLLQESGFFHRAAHGGVSGRSCFTAARLHLGSKAVATRDITDCYPSVSTEQLREKLLELGFRGDTARLLSGLLTCRDRIPQGSPTSTDALNLYLFDLDQEVTALCGRSLAYTRNADDHVISGDDVEEVRQAASLLEGEIEGRDLVVNGRKRERNGLVLAPEIQLVHAIAVNHPTRTRVGGENARRFLDDGAAYVAAAEEVDHRSLPEVARLRRRLLGAINYSKQADLSPAKRLTSLMRSGDALVEGRLRSARVTRSKRWWVKNKRRDRPSEYAAVWERKARTAAEAGSGRSPESGVSSVIQP